MTNTSKDARLTTGERILLSAMTADQATLDRATPGGWWIGDHQVSGNIGWSLMRKHLITTEGEDDTIEYFRINENGRNALLAVEEAT